MKQLVADLLKPVAEFDHARMVWIRAHRSPSLNRFFIFLTHSGDGKWWLIVAVTLAILNAAHYQIIPMQAVFLRAMLCALGAWAIGTAAKKVFKRSRPWKRIEGYSPVIDSTSCNSFPSTHSAASIAFFTALLNAHHPYSWAVGLWAVVVSFSRYYLGVHFPSDLLGGTVLGVVCGYLISGLF